MKKYCSNQASRPTSASSRHAPLASLAPRAAEAQAIQGWTDAPCWQVWISELRVFSVDLHELGHALDFKSVTDTNTVLYHQYRCYTDLKQRDKNAVDDLY